MNSISKSIFFQVILMSELCRKLLFLRRYMLKYLGVISTTYFQMGGMGEVGLCTVERDTISMAILIDMGEELKDIHCTSLSVFLYQKIKRGKIGTVILVPMWPGKQWLFVTLWAKCWSVCHLGSSCFTELGLQGWQKELRGDYLGSDVSEPVVYATYLDYFRIYCVVFLCVSKFEVLKGRAMSHFSYKPSSPNISNPRLYTELNIY